MSDQNSPPEPEGNGPNPWVKSLMIWGGIFLALLMVVSVFGGGSSGAGAQIPYSDFRDKVAEGSVASVQISETQIAGEMKNGEQFSTIPVANDATLPQLLEDNGVRYSGVEAEGGNILLYALIQILPFVLILGIAFFALRQVQKGGGAGGAMGFGKSKAKLLTERQGKVTFDDVAGIDEAREELEEIVEFLKDPQRFSKLGGQIPKGALLVGSPGTGKTLLARAIAGEAGVPFFTISGSDFVEMFVGVGASRVRDMFEQAKKNAPCILFIDEIDAVGRSRGHGLGNSNDEREQTLNQLLTEMDGFDSSVGLIILAATNRPEILDQALLRAGRFDRQVLVDRPDKKGRLDILKVHVKKVTLAQDIDLEQVAALTTGFSGADLANLVNEAALAATRRKASAVELQDFTAAIERIVAGLEKKNRVLNPKERETVAYHEMGHALVALALPGTDPVHKISIIPRGMGALGYTLQRPTEDRFLMTRADLEHKIAVLLGGRAAEKLVFGELSTGAADDLARATDIARDMITRFGMDEGLGYIAFEAQRPRFLDTPELAHGGCRVAESTQARIDQAIRDIVMGVFERAYRILDTNRAVLERCARELLARETLDESDIRQLTQGLVRN